MPNLRPARCGSTLWKHVLISPLIVAGKQVSIQSARSSSFSSLPNLAQPLRLISVIRPSRSSPSRITSAISRWLCARSRSWCINSCARLRSVLSRVMEATRATPVGPMMGQYEMTRSHLPKRGDSCDSWNLTTRFWKHSSSLGLMILSNKPALSISSAEWPTICSSFAPR
jgi:hypothetical protein